MRTISTIQFLENCYLYAGLSFLDDGELLTVTPKERLTDFIRMEVKRRKRVILHILKTDAAKGEPCKVCQWKGDTWGGLCEWCLDPAIEAQAKGDELVKIAV